MKIGLREQKKESVREALETAAVAMIDARGFDEVTADDIAAAASVSRRTFFRYYRTKEEVLFARRRAQLEQLKQILAVDVDGETPLQAIRRVMLTLASEVEKSRARIVREQRIVASHPALTAYDLEIDFEYEKEIALALSRRMGQGKPVQRRARWVAAAVIGVVRATLLEWGSGGGKGDLSAMGREAFDFLGRLEKQ